MRIGIVGYQGSGKSTLFHWLTEEAPDPSLSHKSQMAMCTVPEPRIDQLFEVYQPKKITRAALEIVDTPGLSRTHEGSAAKLAAIRESGCLIIVVTAFGGSDPSADLQNFKDDLLIADLDIVTGRLGRLQEQIKKPRPDRDELVAELAALEPIREALDAGGSVNQLDLDPDQKKFIKSFQLFADKPRLIVINVEDDETDFSKFDQLVPEGVPHVAVPLRLQVELMGMSPEDRAEFCEEMGVAPFDRDSLVRQIMDTSGQMIFFTAGEKEVRTWMLPQGGTAVEAAGNVHTDLARGFIRAEVMQCQDLVEHGSEREVKAAGLMRQEPKDYVIQDGDVVTIRHN